MRDDARPGLRQTFLRAGEVILELVAARRSEPPAAPDPAARFFGIACTVADLDACAILLGDALGSVKDAVQPAAGSRRCAAELSVSMSRSRS